MDLQDIIVASATPPGEGGVAIVRLSGQGCSSLALRYFLPSRSFTVPTTHTLYHGHLIDVDGLLIDEVMFVYMASPRSFTAEDVVEIHCHGGQKIVTKIIQLFTLAGARSAFPGEFSYRAFVNGRIDLSQAEAIADLIHSRSDKALSMALSQLDGQLSRSLFDTKNSIRDSLCLLEAWIDFPEEELPQEDIDAIRIGINKSADLLRKMTDSYNTGRLYTEGASLLLLGKPNVGKSSLMNSLLGEERAIVTEVEGTTRDLLEEGLVIGGVPVRLIDCAGIRESIDPVEKEGVVRAQNKLSSADLVLLLFDGSRVFDEDDFAILELCGSKSYITVCTKLDKAISQAFPSGVDQDAVWVSCKTGEGLDLLRSKICSVLTEDSSLVDNSVQLTNQRHQMAALLAVDCLDRFLESLDMSLSLEFLAVDLRDALSALGAITGETTTDDVLGDIFSRFCIGK